jgi:hypothetical protein
LTTPRFASRSALSRSVALEGCGLSSA